MRGVLGGRVIKWAALRKKVTVAKLPAPGRAAAELREVTASTAFGFVGIGMKNCLKLKCQEKVLKQINKNNCNKLSGQEARS